MTNVAKMANLTNICDFKYDVKRVPLLSGNFGENGECGKISECSETFAMCLANIQITLQKGSGLGEWRF